jgi:hypothetical protein
MSVVNWFLSPSFFGKNILLLIRVHCNPILGRTGNKQGNENRIPSGTIGGKTSKTSVLPGFRKIERGGDSGGVPVL